MTRSSPRPLFLGACLTVVLALFSALRQSTLLYESRGVAAAVLWWPEDQYFAAADVVKETTPPVISSPFFSSSSSKSTVTTAASVTPRPASVVVHNNNNITTTRHATTEPQLVWLVSFPNSGTSYTMMLVERASNRSTATHHGREVENTKGWSTPVYNDSGGGPYWDGTVHLRGRLRPLPATHILTKTHCGSRCANCGPDQYRSSLPAFVQACQRTTGYTAPGSLQSHWVPLSRVAKVLWLMRHPLENIVARYHLERRNWLRKAAKGESLARRVAPLLYNNATGFQHWCSYLDQTFDAVPFVKDDDKDVVDGVLPWSLWSRTPCRGEFYRYTQWHNRVGQMLLVPTNGTDTTTTSTPPVLHDRPLLHWYYEDYASESGSADTNTTLPVDRLLAFVEQERVGPIKEFRLPMPVYRSTHYSDSERRRIWRVLEALATPDTWERLQVYYEDHRREVHDKQDAAAVTQTT